MGHQIDLEELEDYEFTSDIASSFGKNENKKLLARVKSGVVTYEVWNSKELIHSSGMLISASDAYNAL